MNSITHIWGTRRFATNDLSTNNFLIALFTFGEGWHNNHHANPTSSRHGMTGYEVDMNWYGIWALKQLGLAWDIKKVELSDVRKGLVASPNGKLINMPVAEAVSGD